jgi:dihydroneopterin aldolase
LLNVWIKISDYLKSWESREHVDLVETLLFDLLEFCFKDSRILEVEAEILKPTIIEFANYVGVGMKITKELYEIKKNNKEQSLK